MFDAHSEPCGSWFGVYPAKVSSVRDDAGQGRVQVELLGVPAGNETYRVWARLEALMQAVADYERRFLEGEEEDAADWIRYAYEAALEETEMPRRRWSDSTEDYLIES